jgi:hypothetical protein
VGVDESVYMLWPVQVLEMVLAHIQEFDLERKAVSDQFPGRS